MARTRSSDSDGGPLYFIDDNKGRSRPPERKPEKVEKVNPGLGMPGANPLTPSKLSDQRENEELRGHLKMARDLIDRLHAEGASAKSKLKSVEMEKDQYKSALTVVSGKFQIFIHLFQVAQIELENLRKERVKLSSDNKALAHNNNSLASTIKQLQVIRLYFRDFLQIAQIWLLLVITVSPLVIKFRPWQKSNVKTFKQRMILF